MNGLGFMGFIILVSSGIVIVVIYVVVDLGLFSL